MILFMIEYYLSKLLKKMRLRATKNAFIGKGSKIESGTQFINSDMGNHSFCGYDCDINHTSIGHYTSIANKVSIGGGMHPIDWASSSPAFYKGRDSIKLKLSEHERPSPARVFIGSDVWIGEGVYVKQGVSIGNGAVVGMGSVVTKDVPAYSIVAGVPAKLIKMRFDTNIISQLEGLEWWNMSEVVLKDVAKYVRSPKEFINEINKRKL